MKKNSSFGILFRKTLRDLKNSWKQFFAIIFISTLAITLFVGLSANAQSLESRVNKLYKGGNMADIWLYLSVQNSEDDDKINEIIGQNGTFEKRYSYSTKLNGVESTALIYKDYPEINKPYKTSNTSDSNFFIIDENFDKTITADKGDMKTDIGDVAKVSIQLASIMDRLSISEDVLNILDYFSKGDTTEEKKENNIFRKGRIDLEFTITGKMIHPENVQNSSFSSSSFLLDYDYLFKSFQKMVKDSFIFDISPYIGNFDIDTIDVYNQYCIKLTNKSKTSSIKRQIEEYFASKGEDTNLLYVATKDSLPSNAIIQNDIVQARQLTYIFPLVFFIVAILVTLTTLSQIIIKERTQIGTLKAIGLSKTVIFLHYLGLAFFVAFIGIFLGAVIGPLLLPNIMGIKYSLLYTLPSASYIFPIGEFLLISSAFLIATFLVTLLVTYKELKLNPVESMRPASLTNLKAKNNNTKMSNHFSIKMAFRNMRRDKVKSFMVILGVLGCTALLVCGFGIEDTLDFGIDKDVTSFYSSDLYVTYESGASSQIETIKDTTYKDKTIGYYIKDIEEYTKLPATISHKEKIADYSVIALEYGSKFLKFPLSSDKLTVSSKVARELNIKVGDEISFNVLGNQYQGEVGYLYDSFSIHAIILNKDIEAYKSISSTASNAWINLKDVKEAKDLKPAIRELSNVNAVVTKQENAKKIDEVLSSISYMTLAIRVFAIFLAIVVLYNLVLLNYREKTRDIATLKVVGFSMSEIARSLIFEVMFLTTIGIAVGLLFGFPMEYLVLVVNETPIVDFLYHIFPLTYILGFLITFGTAIGTNLVLANFTRKIKMVESLKSVE